MRGGDQILPDWGIGISTERHEIDFLIRMCDKAFAEPIAERVVYSELLEKIYHKGIVLYAYKEDVLAYCAFYANDADGGKAFISLLAVRPEYQGKHIGKRLIEETLQIAQIRGMRTCVLEVKKDNLSAIEFYKATGFVFLSEKNDSYLMKRELSLEKGKTNEYQRKNCYASCDGETGL